jgi:ribosomal-protein-alanine N-acetyltransferase
LRELFERVGRHDARIKLHVRPTNEPPLRLYEGLGFTSAGRRPRYYQDNGEDAVIMWRTPATLVGRLDDIPNVGIA